MTLRPPALRPGDQIRVIAPASPFDKLRFKKGVAVFEDLGFKVVWREDVFESERYLAGTDARRAAEIAEAFADPATKGIVCARGGYGTPRILPSLDFKKLSATPKVLVGFSDITALLLAMHTNGLVGFHGPNVTGRISEVGLDVDEKKSFLRTVGSPEPAGTVANGRTVVEGRAEGPLLGGNLAMVTALLGTKYSPDYKGAILFLEDVGEKPFRLDRMMTHLKLAGVLDAVAGFALGRFSKCVNDADSSVIGGEVVAAIAGATGKPCLVDLPFGHDGENRTLPLGVRARIANGTLEILEAAVT